MPGGRRRCRTICRSARRSSTTCSAISPRFGGDLPPPGLYQRILAEVEYPLVLASMTATRGNQIKAAELLGLNRNTLRKKIRELGVNVYRARRRPELLTRVEVRCIFATMCCLKDHA